LTEPARTRHSRFQVFVVAQRRRVALEATIGSWCDRIGLPADVVALHTGERPPPGMHEWSDGAIGVIADLDEVLGRARLVEFTPIASDSAVVLPNGLSVVEHRRGETMALVAEILERRSYLQHGLRIADGDVVVDIGANVGLFGAFCHLEADHVTVHAIEPAPASAALLRTNTARQPWATVVHELAIDDHDGTLPFTYFDECSLLSGLRADPTEAAVLGQAYARRQSMRAGLTSPALGDAFPAVWRPVVCEVKVETLETFLDRNGVATVGLLKIDAEGSELDVLSSTTQATWSRIRQVVVEVHGGAAAAQRAVELLATAGFETRIGQDIAYAGSDTFMVWARRPGPVGLTDRDGRRAAAFVDAAASLRSSGLDVVVAATASSPLAHDDVARAALAELTERCEAKDITLLDVTQHAGAPAREQHGGHGDVAMGTEMTRRLTASARPPTKVIVVDADNTLWDGVCGEDTDLGFGPDWAEVQRLLLDQAAAGRALVLCSHNDIADVEEGFARLPTMPLALGDFDDLAIGWEPKSTLIARALRRLGSTADACVVIDDDPAVRRQIQTALPGATVVDLPADPTGRAAALRDTWSLDVHGLTATDRRRSQARGEEQRRDHARERAGTRREWLEGLGLQVQFYKPGSEDVPRLADLTRRTNQFNMTLRRHGPAAIADLLERTPYAWAVRVRDAFGDYGIVGLVVARRDDDVLDVTDWALSCRALGRNVEWAVIEGLGAVAGAAGLRRVRVRAVERPRNTAARAFVQDLAAYGDSTISNSVTIDARVAARLDWLGVDTSAAEAPAAASTVGDARWPTARWPAPAPSIADVASWRGARSARPHIATPFIPARTPLAQRVSLIFNDVLGCQVGIDDDLRALGGDSVGALRICEAVGDALGVRPSLTAFLKQPTVRALVSLLESPVDASPQPPAGGVAVPPVTAGRRRLWAALRANGRRPEDVIPMAFEVDGRVDRARLVVALQEVCDAHPVLGETVVDDGVFGLRVRTSTVAVPVLELDAGTYPTTTAVAAALARRVDLIDGPLTAAALLPGTNSTLLVVVVHHACFDGASVPRFLEDLQAAYGGQGLGRPSERAYAQYAARQAAAAGNRTRIASIASLLARASRRPAPPPAGGNQLHRFAVDAERSKRVAGATRQLLSTPAVIELAAMGVAWSALTGEEDIVLAFMTANRDGVVPPDAIGFFANVVPVRVQVPPAQHAHDYVQQVQTEVDQALDRAAIPYGSLLEELHGDPFVFTPPFDVLVTRNLPAPTVSLAGAPARLLWTLPERPAFPVMLDLQPSEKRMDAASASAQEPCRHPAWPNWATAG